MIRKILSYAAAEGFAKGINWLTIILLSLILSVPEYGKVGLVFAIENVSSMILLMGQEKSILRFQNNTDENVFSEALKINFFMGVIACGIIGVLYFFGVNFVSFPFYVIVLLFISVWLYGSARLFMTFARSIDNIKLFWSSRAVYQVTKLVFVLIFCYYTKSYIGYILALLVSSLVTNVVFLSRMIRYAEFAVKKRFKVRKFTLGLVAFGWPFIFQALSGNILSFADRFFVNGFLSKTDLGIYTFVCTIGTGISFIFIALSAYFEPLAYRYADNPESYKTILVFYRRFLIAMAAILSMLIMILFNPIVSHLSNKDYLNGFSILYIILVSYILNPFYFSYNYQLTIQKRTKYVAISTICCAILNLVLNFILIPSFGLKGAAISTLICYFALSYFSNIIANYREQSRYKRFIDLDFLTAIIIISPPLILKFNYWLELTALLALIVFFTVRVLGMDIVREKLKLSYSK
jgi:O-antigen/teichoic acid export membrane protein